MTSSEAAAGPETTNEAAKDMMRTFNLVQLDPSRMDDPSAHLRDVRSQATFDSWAENRDFVVSAGHTWCPLGRDNWACMGGAYKRALKKTQPWAGEGLALDRLRPGTRLFIEGNSYMGEVVTSWICESFATWARLSAQGRGPLRPVGGSPPGNVTAAEDGKLGSSSSSSSSSSNFNDSGYPAKTTLTANVELFHSGDTNNLFVAIKQPDVQLLLVDNDPKFNLHPGKTDATLLHWGWPPTLIVLGEINHGHGFPGFPSREERERTHSDSFPDALVLSLVGKTLLGCSCPADMRDCVFSAKLPCSHQCFPGPSVLRPAEVLAEHLIDLSVVWEKAAKKRAAGKSRGLNSKPYE